MRGSVSADTILEGCLQAILAGVVGVYASGCLLVFNIITDSMRGRVSAGIILAIDSITVGCVIAILGGGAGLLAFGVMIILSEIQRSVAGVQSRSCSRRFSLYFSSFFPLGRVNTHKTSTFPAGREGDEREACAATSHPTRRTRERLRPRKRRRRRVGHRHHPSVVSQSTPPLCYNK